MPMSQSDTWKLIADGPRQVAATARQAPRREAEETLRQQAAALSDALARRGRRNVWVSRRLRLSRRTLTRWRRRRRQSRGFLPRGRPCKESPSVRRHAVLEMLDREGPHIGLPTLRRVPRSAALRTGRTAGRLPPPLSPVRGATDLAWGRLRVGHGPCRPAQSRQRRQPCRPSRSRPGQRHRTGLAAGVQPDGGPHRGRIEIVDRSAWPPIGVEERQWLGLRERGVRRGAGRARNRLATFSRLHAVVQWQL